MLKLIYLIPGAIIGYTVYETLMAVSVHIAQIAAQF